MDGGTGSTEEQGEWGTKEPKAEKMKTIPETENDKRVFPSPHASFPSPCGFSLPALLMDGDRQNASGPPSLPPTPFQRTQIWVR